MSARIKAFAVTTIAGLALGLTACSTDSEIPEVPTTTSSSPSSSSAPATPYRDPDCDYTGGDLTIEFGATGGGGDVLVARALADGDKHLIEDVNAQSRDLEGAEYSDTEFYVGWMRSAVTPDEGPETLEGVKMGLRMKDGASNCVLIDGTATKIPGEHENRFIYDVQLDEAVPEGALVDKGWIAFENPFDEGLASGELYPYSKEDTEGSDGWSLLGYVNKGLPQ